ncbi:4401_t:CDS:2 [Funneliformis mosseae]|uniref:4401_t:CDS:1 n=1 Tax=Funneliformis mosseae TaxID=27381 RepID=A0A9N9BS92_FUNMO|nr:4401_t:CDS:2 [Funneliformis mosseae]
MKLITKAALKNVTQNKIGKFFIELEGTIRNGLDDTFSENDWRNNEVSDWKSDTDLEAK